MDIIIPFLSGDPMARLITALLHTLWQGTLIAGILYVFLRRTPAQRAETRYVLATLALGGIVFAGLITWARFDMNQKTHIHPVSSSPTQTTSLKMTQSSSNSSMDQYMPQDPLPNTPPWTSWAAGVWFTGVTIMFLRTLVHLLGAGRLRRDAVVTEDQTLLNNISHLRQLMKITQNVQVSISNHISSPAVLGVLWPTILVPASMLSGIPADQLRAIFAHELAHIRRYDYLVNLIQMLIEILFFFNPAVWWISRQIRIEREACCDQIAVAATGQTFAYIQTLTDWVRRLRPLPVTMPAFADATPPSKLLDRVKRLLAPSHRPALRLSWPAMTVTVITAVILLAGLRAGTLAAVKILSPKERIEKMEKIRETYNPPDEDILGVKGYITVSGSVETLDKHPLPKNTQMKFYSFGKNASSSRGIPLTRKTFSTDVDFGVIYIQVYTPDSEYAPAFAGPLKTKPGVAIKDIKLVLEPGFQARLRLIDPAGKPVPNAQLTGGYKTVPFGYSHILNFTTASNGFITFIDSGKVPVAFNLTKEGYQTESRDFTFSPGRTELWTITPANPVTGTVYSSKTGKPIPNAVIRRLFERKQSGGTQYSPEDAPILAKTDSTGRFTLNTLRDDSLYYLYIEASGYGSARLDRIQPGQQNLKIPLGPELYVRGKIIGPPGKPDEYLGPKQISYTKISTVETSGNRSMAKSLNLQIRDGFGYFDIKDLWIGQLEITADGKNFLFDIDKSTDDLVIDLSSNREEKNTLKTYPQRELVLKITVPKNSPPPTGKIKLEACIAKNDHVNKQVFVKELPIKNSEIRIQIPAPGSISYEPVEMVDYWIRSRQNLKILPGSESCVLTIPAVPSGAIYGEVVNPDNSPAAGVLVSGFVKEKSSLTGDDFRHLHFSVKPSAGGFEPDTKFMAAPLPFGGSYFVVAHRGDSYVVSSAVKIDEANPIRRIKLKLVEGVSVPVTILDQNGRPVPNIFLHINYNLPDGDGFGGGTVADHHGRHVFEHINPNAPGSYAISLPNQALYQPVFQKFIPDGKPVTIRLKPGLVVTGTVVDDNTGYPIPGVEVYAIADDQQYDTAHNLEPEDRTNKKGEFRFSNMPDRKYKLYCRSGGRLGREGILVRPGQSTPVILRIDIPEGSDLKPNTSAPKIKPDGPGS